MTNSSTRRSQRKSLPSTEKEKGITKNELSQVIFNKLKSDGASTSLSRQWSIEQETTLFKAICRFKPTGKHKHFRMISIYQMVNNPNITPTSTPITTKDIWEKLESLYDLTGLDELEDSSEFMADEEKLQENSKSVPYYGSLGGIVGDGTYLQEFYLPWGDYSALIIDQALPKDGQLSDDSDDQVSDDDLQSDDNSTYSNVSKKRGRSQSIDSQNQDSELSEVENEESDTGKKPISVNRSKKSKTKKSANVPHAPSRTTRNTRQRAAAAAAKAVTMKQRNSSESGNANEEDEETGTEHSENEGSVPPPEGKSSTKSASATRAKRSKRNTKTQLKSKSTAAPTRRSSRRK